ncbi:MAG: AraC family transcriptional regulator, partial [Chthoniobacterales bacterium]
LHIIWNYGKHLKPQVIGSRAEDLRRLQPALAYLRLHLAESPPVGLLARQSGLSEPQFRRVFHRALGLSPVNYLRNLRMERACALLKTTDLTLEAIAEQIGYQGASFFVTTFRKQFGIPPGIFRHQPLS